MEAFLSETSGGRATVTSARRLTGGASRETWALDVDIAGAAEAGRHALVLRCDLGGNILEEAVTREREFHLLQLVNAGGVRVPRPRWLCTDLRVLGVPFFLMERLEGESVGRRIVREPALAEARQRLPAQMGEQLARIHAVPPPPGLSQPDQGQSPALTAVERSAHQLWQIDEPHPVLELALRWLRRNAPAGTTTALVHGDFRIGNLMIGAEGLRGIFDWEFAHVGDPAEDLAWPCVRSWRFGEDRLRLGGIGDAEKFFAAYEQYSGRRVDRQAVFYWEVLGNLRWAVGCMVQAQRHLSGRTPSIELASLGRRTAEMELELLHLLTKGHDHE